MNYGSFYQRFMAMWIDMFVVMVFVLPCDWISGYSKVLGVILLIPAFFAYAAYCIYCHGRFGQTVGKKIMKIKVVRLDGNAIGWKSAWLRSIVDLAWGLLTLSANLLAIWRIPDAQYYAAWTQRAESIHSMLPVWVGWLDTAVGLWALSEVIVMLFNEKRRALHDFIAGRMVISLNPAPDPDAAP